MKSGFAKKHLPPSAFVCNENGRWDRIVKTCGRFSINAAHPRNQE